MRECWGRRSWVIEEEDTASGGCEEAADAMGNAGSAPDQPKNSADGAGAADAESRRGPPSTVRFFPDAERHKARQPPPIKLEEEEGVPPPPATEEEMAPRNLWQVRLRSKLDRRLD